MQECYSNSSPDALERIFQGPLNWVNLLMVALNIVVFIVAEFFGDTENAAYMLRIGAAYTPWILGGEWYRLFTSMFLHFGIGHLFNNMVLLLFLGDMLEEMVGKWRYLLIYLGGGLIGNILSMYLQTKTGDMSISAGASGAVFAVIGGILIVLIKHKGRIENMTAKRVLFVIVLSIYHGFQTTGVDNAAHIGGVAGGILLTSILYKKRFPVY